MSPINVISELITAIRFAEKEGVFKVAIDGLMGSGKTSIATEISSGLRDQGVDVILASVDDFFNCRRIPYTRGFASAEGCYGDTIDLEGMKKYLLQPLGQDGTKKIKAALFDAKNDRPINAPWIELSTKHVLILEGLFLHRPELVKFGDFSIFLKVNSENLLSRAVKRDASLFDNIDELLFKHDQRYMPAQELYLRQVAPESKANIVIDNNDYKHPKIVYRN